MIELLPSSHLVASAVHSTPAETDKQIKKKKTFKKEGEKMPERTSANYEASFAVVVRMDRVTGVQNTCMHAQTVSQKHLSSLEYEHFSSVADLQNSNFLESS